MKGSMLETKHPILGMKGSESVLMYEVTFQSYDLLNQ